MKFINLMTICASLIFITACSSASGIGPRPGFGMIVVSELAPGSAVKNGVHATTDTGRYLFAPSRMSGNGQQNGSFVGESAPARVRVTWREGNIVQASQGGWDGGTIVGDYTIEVASRIPAEVMKYASEGKERAIKLTFRIKDDGVLLAWGVQENYGGLNTESLRGGDFPCSPTSQFATRPTCTSGYLKDAPWYRP